MAGLSEHFARAWLLARGYCSHFIPTSVGRVHVLDASGTGRRVPPVVLLHGMSAAGVHFIPLLDRLRPHVRRLLAPDLLVHGFSDSPASGASPAMLQAGLFEALDATLNEPAIFYGNSMGGLAAARYALARPERVAGLILCSPAGAAMNRSDLHALLQRFRMDSHGAALHFVDQLMSEPTPLRHLLAWSVHKRFNHPELLALLASITPEDMLRPEQVRALQPPVLLVWGKRERILPTEHGEFFRRNLPPHARVEEPPRFGHSPYLEYPGAVARQILAFARTLENAEEGGRSAA